MADAIDALNFARLSFADVLVPEGIDLRRVDEVLAKYLRNKRRLVEDFRVIVNCFIGKQTIGRKKEEMLLPNSCKA